MLLISSSSLAHYDLEHFFEFAKKARYDGVEITVTEDRIDTQNPEYLKELENRFSLPVKAFSLDPSSEETITEEFQHTVREFPESTMILNTPKTLSFKYKKWVNDIAIRLAQKYNLTLCRRNAPAKNFFGFLPERSEGSLITLKEAGNVCLDLTALAASHEEIMHTVAYLGKNLKHVYLSNVRRGIPYALPQNGVLPVESFLTKLSQIKYKGDFTLKVDPKQLYEGDNQKVHDSLIDCRKFYEKYFLQLNESI